MAGKIRLGLLLVLGILVMAVSLWSYRDLSTRKPRPQSGYSLEFRYEGPNPSHYSTIALEGDGIAQDPARAARQMLSQIPGEPNMVAVLSSQDGKVRQEWRWVNRTWTRTDKPQR
jgi:hypothetical protein